jgi:DNA-binding transcriptional LysR family regulator
VAVLPRYFVERELAEGSLVAIFPRIRPRSDWFRLVFRADDPRHSAFSRLAGLLRALPLR